MARLDAGKRASLPNSAFAYIDDRGRRRLPIHDEAHVRNALARFNQVRFDSDEARERARTRLLNAAKKYGLVPVGFIAGQLRVERRDATAGRLVIELGRHGAPGELEERLQRVLGDRSLSVLHWSEAAGAYLDRTGKPAPLPDEGEERVVTFLERDGRPMTALVHHPRVLEDPDLANTVLSTVRFAVEKERSHGAIPATATAAAALPTGFVTLLMTDIERSTALLRRLGDRYGDLLNDVRRVLRAAVVRWRGREIDARADEFFAVFERAADAVQAAIAAQRTLAARQWPESVGVRVRMGLHSGRPTLTDAGYIGLAVHTTARVCAAAKGGQIVVSEDTHRALADEPPAGIRFRSLGRRRLRGLPKAQMLFRVEAAGVARRPRGARVKAPARAKRSARAKPRVRAKAPARTRGRTRGARTRSPQPATARRKRSISASSL